MSVQADFYQFSKRKNSTKQPTGAGTAFNVELKSGTSLMAPTLLLNNSGYPNYNYCVFMGFYYFVRDIVSVRNDLWEIYLSIDPLATAKSAITGSTQFVSYSASSALKTWLPDVRIPALKSATVAKNVTSMNFVFNDTGFYVLSVIGKDGSALYMMDKTTVAALVTNISQWTDDLKDAIDNALPYATPADETEALQNVASAISGSGVLGNSYLDAPSCIRSCIWVPFFAADFVDGSSNVYLGQYAVGYPNTMSAFRCKASPITKTTTVTIPWQYNDYRRATNEEVYLYLPLVGMVNIPSDEVINETTISIETSCTATDGAVCYKVSAGNQVIGTFGANCAANFPIGVSQQASAGEIINSVISGAEKMTSAAVHGSISPTQAPAALASVAATAAVATYDTVSVAQSRHNSYVGGIGGGAGAGLSLDVTCFTVKHPTVVEPADMAATMGVPVMAPTALSGLSGYCQCSNAHVEGAFPSPILEAVDTYLNSGFFIE
jgi:hypothetical protein